MSEEAVDRKFNLSLQSLSLFDYIFSCRQN